MKRILKRTESDRWLFGVTLCLCLLGAVMIFSASAVTAEHDYGHSYYFVLRQSVWLVLGVAGMFALMRMDYRKLREPIVVYTALCAVVLMLVGAFFLDKSHATHRWIRFGPVGFQPSEIAKLAVILSRSKTQIGRAPGIYEEGFHAAHSSCHWSDFRLRLPDFAAT
jgi:cell division protein FtsW